VQPRRGNTRPRRFIAVDPINEHARTFYEVFGFKPAGGDDSGRMYLRTDEAVAT